jgi:hypothetical protein
MITFAPCEEDPVRGRAIKFKPLSTQPYNRKDRNHVLAVLTNRLSFTEEGLEGFSFTYHARVARLTNHLLHSHTHYGKFLAGFVCICG